MKHLLPILTAAMALMATAVSAADTLSYNGFTVTPKEYDNKGFQGVGDGDFYTIEFTSDSKLYLLNHMNSLYGDVQTETLGAMGITDYGYYKNGSSTLEKSYSLIKGKDNYVTAESFEFSLDKSKTNGKETWTRTGYFLGDFKAGDKVEIWMTDGTTSVSSNTLLPSADGNGGAYSGRFDGRTDLVTTYSSDGTVIPVAQLYLYNSPSGYQVNFGFYAVSSGEGGGGGGAGAPLPGGLQIALIAGLFGLGLWYVRRRKATVA